MNALSKIEQHNPIRTDGFAFVACSVPTAASLGGSLPYLAVRVSGA